MQIDILSHELAHPESRVHVFTVRCTFWLLPNELDSSEGVVLFDPDGPGPRHGTTAPTWSIHDPGLERRLVEYFDTPSAIAQAKRSIFAECERSVDGRSPPCT